MALVDVAAVFTATAAARSWPSSLALAGLSLAALAAVGLYRRRLILSALDDVVAAALGVGVAWAVTSWIAGPTPAPDAVPAASAWWWLVVAGCVVIARALAYARLRRRRARRPEPAVVIGTGEVALRLAEGLSRQPECGLRPVGLLGPADSPPARTSAVPLLGGFGALEDVLADTGAQHLLVAFAGVPDAELVAALRRCRQAGRTVYVVPRLFELSVRGAGAELVAGVPLVRLPPAPAHRWSWLAKRPLDVVGAALALALVAPLFAVCAVALRREVGRDGVLFEQQRVGEGGRRFRMMKFRSLTPSSEAESQERWNVGDDGRVGPVGQVVRRTSMDELPQLVNVLRGEMSLVGPRPERPFFVRQFGARYRRYPDRLRVPPGLTGWAQIHGLRGDTSIEERAMFDNYYIENWSLGLDLKILFRTLVTVIRFPGR